MWTILDISVNEARALVQRFRKKGSILEDLGGGRWRFVRLFRQFLARMMHKYATPEQLERLYQRAMYFYEEKQDYTAALCFADLLKLHDKMAELLDRILSRPISYETFLSLEDYCLSEPLPDMLEYPRLIMAGAMLECIGGNLEGYERYRKLLERREKKDTGSLLLILKMIGTGSMWRKQIRLPERSGGCCRFRATFPCFTVIRITARFSAGLGSGRRIPTRKRFDGWQEKSTRLWRNFFWGRSSMSETSWTKP